MINNFIVYDSQEKIAFYVFRKYLRNTSLPVKKKQFSKRARSFKLHRFLNEIDFKKSDVHSGEII